MQLGQIYIKRVKMAFIPRILESVILLVDRLIGLAILPNFNCQVTFLNALLNVHLK